METCDAFWELIAQCMSFFDTGKRNMTPPPPPPLPLPFTHAPDKFKFLIVFGERGFLLTNVP